MRQVHESVLITHGDRDIILNSKSEWMGESLPRLLIEVQEKVKQIDYDGSSLDLKPGFKRVTYGAETNNTTSSSSSPKRPRKDSKNEPEPAAAKPVLQPVPTASPNIQPEPMRVSILTSSKPLPRVKDLSKPAITQDVTESHTGVKTSFLSAPTSKDSPKRRKRGKKTLKLTSNKVDRYQPLIRSALVKTGVNLGKKYNMNMMETISFFRKKIRTSVV